MVKLAVFVEEALREAREAALGIAAACVPAAVLWPDAGRLW